ncbi:MAG TPA: hypothetical protein VFS05_13240 [Gemmatimonadaceae bacterium]|nr:hypothetical protein [Gemmatimonadaceae bacterium]
MSATGAAEQLPLDTEARPDGPPSRFLRIPHPLVLLTAFVLLAAALTWLLPAGEFLRRDDPATGRSVVVAGTYHQVEARPVGLFDAVVAIPRGIIAAADVVVLVFLVGGAWAVVERTGVLGRMVEALARALEDREWLVIPVCCIVFAVGGLLTQMEEELIAFVPVLVLLVRRFGFDRLTAVAISFGTSIVGAWFSPINPFMVGIAQKLAGVPLLSGSALRIVFLVVAVAIWIWAATRHALRTRTAPERLARGEIAGARFGWREWVIVALVLVTFTVYVVGVLRLGWGFEQMSAAFFIMGVLAGLVGGLGLRGTADALVDGFRALTYAAVLIGFARAISVVLADGRIIDTIVQGMFAPVAGVPGAVAAMAMTVLHALLHIPVSSTSGQAVLTMPILVPLSDLLGISRQVTVLAYQYGAGFTEILTPTNGALMAMLAAAGVTFDEWLRFALRWAAVLLALGAVAILVALALGIR